MTFLYLVEGPDCGKKIDVCVEVPHLSRAEFLARDEGFPTHRWAVYGIAEVREPA